MGIALPTWRRHESLNPLVPPACGCTSPRAQAALLTSFRMEKAASPGPFGCHLQAVTPKIAT